MNFAKKRKYKIVYLHGGLGNQLFQFSFAKFLESNGFDVRLDSSILHLTNVHKGYRLDAVTSDPLTISTNLINRLSDKSYKFLKLKLKILNSSKLFKRIFSVVFLFDSTYLEKTFTDYVSLKQIKSKKYFFGYFQNQLFIENGKKFDIKSIFELNETNSISYSRSLQKLESVSVHIRRGDYVGTLHDLNGFDYYSRAIGEIKRLIKEPVFFFFSDNKEYTDQLINALISKNIMILDEVSQIDLPIDRSEVIDFFLMLYCKNNIITNSTFSWWAAYLNQNPAKKVVMPTNWISGIKYEKKALKVDSWISI